MQAQRTNYKGVGGGGGVAYGLMEGAQAKTAKISYLFLEIIVSKYQTLWFPFEQKIYLSGVLTRALAN